jgi:dienelactone hydrolase
MRKLTARRRGVLGLALLALAAAISLATVLERGASVHDRGAGAIKSRTAPVESRGAKTPLSRARPTSFAVGLRVLRLTDTSRTIRLANGTTEPRTMLTYVRYPALAPPGATDVSDAPTARADGPFPLVIFGHGFAVTPRPYARLLRAWASAGYVVAAPAFPLENANAPGGPDETDLINQPADMSFVISRMLAASRAAAAGPFVGLIDPARIAVSGQSDGGDTALAVGYDPSFRDPRVGATIILSGALLPAAGAFAFPRAGPPLLAAQGTADTVNPPSLTNAFFAAATRPKYLLSLLGAEHLPPYSDQQPQLAIVERVTIAFLDRYLGSGLLPPLTSAGTVPGIAELAAHP